MTKPTDGPMHDDATLEGRPDVSPDVSPDAALAPAAQHEAADAVFDVALPPPVEPSDAPALHPALLPYVFLLGTWRGQGLGSYPTIENFGYGQEISFSHAGKPVLVYTSRTWDAVDGRPLAFESGFWRPQPDGALEVVIAHASGVVEVSVGSVSGPKIELVTDLLARTASAKEVAALHRLYGLVDGELMYAIDMAAVGQPLQPHLSARLHRVPTSPAE